MSDDEQQGATGSSLEGYLDRQGNLNETTTQAVKRLLAHQLTVAMKEQRISKVQMAKRLHTSRPQLDRLLDPSNDRVTLGTLSCAAEVVGRSLNVELR